VAGPWARQILGFLVNAAWSWFNVRWEKRTLEHIDDLNAWIPTITTTKSFWMSGTGSGKVVAITEKGRQSA
jgi:hypothetical protein